MEEFINVLTWSPHPENPQIQKYKIYQLDKSERIPIAEINSGVYSYYHRHIQKEKEYNYIIVSVDNQGRESFPFFLKIE
jgi:hypothetical protein